MARYYSPRGFFPADAERSPWLGFRHAVSTKVTLLSTYEFPACNRLIDCCRRSVRHGAEQYVYGAIQTNTTEGFWSMVKRVIVGTFHNTSKKYLRLGVNESEFRYNSCEIADIFSASMKGCV